MTFFRKKSPFSHPKFLMTFFLFLVINQVFRIFPYLYSVNIICDPFFTRKTPISENNSFTTLFYSVCAFAHIRQHYFSKLWGDGCMGRPPTSIFLGGPSPSVPIGLRP